MLYFSVNFQKFYPKEKQKKQLAHDVARGGNSIGAIVPKLQFVSLNLVWMCQTWKKKKKKTAVDQIGLQESTNLPYGI